MRGEQFCKVWLIAVYLTQEFPDHAVPLLRVLVHAAVVAVGHDADLVVKVEDLGDVLDQVDVVALELVVARQRLLVLLVHDVGLGLDLERKWSVTIHLTNQILSAVPSNVVRGSEVGQYSEDTRTNIVVMMRVLFPRLSTSSEYASVKFRVKFVP